MAKTVVVDTNVLLVANGRHGSVSRECIANCSVRLDTIKRDGQISIDNKRRIISEYQNKTSPNQPKGAGDVFLKWLFQNLTNKRVRQIDIGESDDGSFDAIQPPQQFAALKADRKFIAVALKDTQRPSILQAADTKWIDHEAELKQRGIAIEFLCPHDIKKLSATNRRRKNQK